MLFRSVLFLAGMLVMAWNVFRTVSLGKPVEARIPSLAGAAPAAA